MLRWTRLDSLLAAGAALGLAALALLLPRLHPDAAADFPLDAHAIGEIALSEAARMGYRVEGWPAHAVPKRNDDLLDTLQHRFGRAGAVALLSDTAASRALPAYYWQVDIEQPDGSDDADDLDYEELWFSITTQGEPFEFVRTVESAGSVARDIDAGALQAAAEGALPDSTLERIAAGRLDLDFSFDKDAFADALAPPGSDAANQQSLTDWLAGAPDGTTAFVSFGRGEAVRMAEHHLSRSVVGAAVEAARPDSVILEGTAVRLFRWGTVGEVPVRAEVAVEPTGRLIEVEIDYSPHPSGETNVGFVVFAVGTGAAYVLLALTLLVYFARRLIARTVDVRTALIDGVAVALPFALFTVFSTVFASDEGGPSTWVALLILFPVMLILTTVALTVLAGSVEGPAREAWPEKLRASTLVRRAYLVNARVGYALVRGTLAGAVLAGLSALLLLVPLPLRLNEDPGMLLAAFPVRGVIPFLIAAPTAYALLSATLLGLGSFLRRWHARPAWLLLAVAATLALLGPLTSAFNPPWATWLTALPVALGLTAVFLRYDFLTAFCAAFFTMIVWMGAHYAALSGFATTVDAAVIAVVTLGALGLGTFGIRSGRTGDEAADYVPTYVSEMAQQERMKQELEFARQVQAAFLPRVMPDVPGVDTAALCIAASEVGGDYYDLMPLAGGRLGVAIGDVSGKGIQAAFYMTLVKGFLRSLVRRHDSPADVLRELNALFRENVPRGTFISMIYGVLDPATGTFTFARAGHNPLLVRRATTHAPGNGSLELARPRGVGIGFLGPQGFDVRIEEQTLRLGPGDSVTLYTDGFSEAMNASRAQYGDDRLASQVDQLGARTASEIVGGVATDVQHFTGSAAQHDDMTMVVVRMAPGAQAGA